MQPYYIIIIDTANHILSLYKDYELYNTYPIAVGKPRTPTPKGSFKIINKSINPGGPFGARWMGLSKRRYGIHGTNKPDSIGKDISNGCIRLHNKDVIKLYELVSIGTTVEIV